MRHLTCEISSLHSVNLILLTILLIYLIVRISPHHSHFLLHSCGSPDYIESWSRNVSRLVFQSLGLLVVFSRRISVSK